MLLDQHFAKAQAAIRWPDTEEGPDQSQANPHGICDGQSNSWKGFSPRTSLLTCQYHSTNVAYSFVDLPSTPGAKIAQSI